ncbi:hypothetical protein [endosymbiont GvMRE of Glomus versiforme]|uniref:hypothetical protein n=1 Tax=endosymbiont GvMRE of Glomus versiforme TaxID=2039283 RepID=UPI000EDBAD1D|nr:hypothetical protein [endosymbiont GvMRE of Glomus versiforme]RHZ35222.1 hypothetical protein GvMRE_IIg43 [endosymbiont GvMRE of Glomus versiforme]
MTREYLQAWYNNGDISYSEKERLNKLGVGDYENYSLKNLKQILFCERVAKDTWIRNKIDGTITKIEFFWPRINTVNFTTNYSVAFVRNSNGTWWVIVYRSSYAGEIESDLIVKTINGNDRDRIRRELSSDNPILALAPTSNWISVGEIIKSPYVNIKTLPSEAKNNPDRYILPLDIVKRPIGTSGFYHFAIYLGDKWVVHITGKEEGVNFDSWYNFCNPSGGSSSSAGLGSGTITKYHPVVPFKQYEIVYPHIANAIASSYGKARSKRIGEIDLDVYDYYWKNCEAIANEIIFGIDTSIQSRGNDAQISLRRLIEATTNKLGSLPCSSGTYRVFFDQSLDCMGDAQKNRIYNRSQEITKDECFNGYIEVQPNPPCKIQ